MAIWFQIFSSKKGFFYVRAAQCISLMSRFTVEFVLENDIQYPIIIILIVIIIIIIIRLRFSGFSMVNLFGPSKTGEVLTFVFSLQQKVSGLKFSKHEHFLDMRI